jgi:hypothetical protein
VVCAISIVGSPGWRGRSVDRKTERYDRMYITHGATDSSMRLAA